MVRLGRIGSFAGGEQTGASDLHLLMVCEGGTDVFFDKKIKLRNLLKISYHREVDICPEKGGPPHRKSCLLRAAICVGEEKEGHSSSVGAQFHPEWRALA